MEKVVSFKRTATNWRQAATPQMTTCAVRGSAAIGRRPQTCVASLTLQEGDVAISATVMLCSPWERVG